MIDPSNIFVDFPEYSYFKELAGYEKIQYLIEIYDMETKKQDIDPIQLASGLNEFFSDLDAQDQEFEFDSYHLDGQDRVDIMIDVDNVLIESNSLKAVRHIRNKCIDSGYLLKRDIESEKIFKKNKIARYLRVYNIIGTMDPLCYS